MSVNAQSGKISEELVGRQTNPTIKAQSECSCLSLLIFVSGNFQTSRDQLIATGVYLLHFYWPWDVEDFNEKIL